MNAEQAKGILDKVVGAVFGYQNPLTLEQAMEKFAFDLNLPQQVYDGTTNQPTWANSINPSRFVTMENSQNREWELPKTQLNTIEDIILGDYKKS